MSSLLRVDGRSRCAVTHLANELGVKRQDLILGPLKKGAYAALFWFISFLVYLGIVKMKENRKSSNNSKLKLILKDFAYRAKVDNLSSHAASCAFFIFLSIIPMMILICSIIPYTPLKESDLIDIISREIPTSVGGLLVSLVSEVYDKSIGVISLSIIATVWSAGKGVNALITGLNAIEHVEDKRNPLLTRLLSSLYTLIFLAAMIVYLTLMVYGKIGKNILVGYFPRLSYVFNILVLFRSVITIVLMTVVFTVLYAILPYAKRRMRVQLFWAFFTAVTWTLFSYLFSLYVENFSAFSLYGSFATIMVMCVWLYFCMYLVFVGANLNKYFRPVFLVIDKNMRRKPVKYQGESLEE